MCCTIRISVLCTWKASHAPESGGKLLTRTSSEPVPNAFNGLNTRRIRQSLHCLFGTSLPNRGNDFISTMQAHSSERCGLCGSTPSASMAASNEKNLELVSPLFENWMNYFHSSVIPSKLFPTMVLHSLHKSFENSVKSTAYDTYDLHRTIRLLTAKLNVLSKYSSVHYDLRLKTKSMFKLKSSSFIRGIERFLIPLQDAVLPSYYFVEQFKLLWI